MCFSCACSETLTIALLYYVKNCPTTKVSCCKSLFYLSYMYIHHFAFMWAIEVRGGGSLHCCVVSPFYPVCSRCGRCWGGGQGVGRGCGVFLCLFVGVFIFLCEALCVTCIV